MGRRKRRIAKNVNITGIADKGRAVGRDEEGMVYFVTGAVPGDVVDVWVKKKKNSYRQGVVEAFISYSGERVNPFCEHFGNCGGCKWQNLDYSSQLHYKEQSVLASFERLGQLEIEEKRAIIPCDEQTAYRNKMEYSFSSRRWVPQEELDAGGEVEFGQAVGFHRAGAFNKVVQIEKCHLQDDLSNQIRNHVHALALEHKWTYYNYREQTGFLRNLLVRNTTLGDWMVIPIFGKDHEEDREILLSSLMAHFPQITSLHYVINTKANDSLQDQTFISHHGEKTITEKLGHVEYKIGPKSFFQTNSHQAKRLYDEIVNLADLKGTELVYDLYTGLGSIALYIADKCKKVIGVEEVAPAIEDANVNKALNGIDNVDFHVGDCKAVFTGSFVEENGQPDLIIVDPPRAGLHQDVVTVLGNTGVEKIIYVSCNPGTQARDLAMLANAYDITLMQPVDMFPHTHHIENIALLKRK